MDVIFGIWAVLMALTVLLAWITDKSVNGFVGLAIFCTPIETFLMLIGLMFYPIEEPR